MGVLHWRPPLGPLRGCASAARLHCAAGRHRGPLRGWHCGAQQGGAGPSAARQGHLHWNEANSQKQIQPYK
eukprot:scaffold11588_cov19-Tisochrysis_lutea.AAC.2